MKTPASIASTTTAAASSRGERLYPPRSSRLFWHLTALRNRYMALVKEFLGEQRVEMLVDYGCGNKPYESLFQVNRYIGADFPGNELADVLVSEDGALPLEAECASVVLSSQVLEHVVDVDKYLAEARRVLEADGLLLLSTHGVWRYHPDPCDLWRWTCDGLRRVIGRAGFEIISFHGVMGPEATALQLWQDATLSRVPRVVRRWFTYYMQWRIQRADERCSDVARARDACVYVVVARKCTSVRSDV